MANRKYKDTVFRAFFNHEREIAELYQAIRPGDDVRAEDITITTLDDVFLDQQKNDLSFLWKDQSVVLVEHQSSLNPNMPYRLLIYSALVMLASFADSKALYGTKLVKIPAPHFYVLYIGDDMEQDEETLKLSGLSIVLCKFFSQPCRTYASRPTCAHPFRVGYAHSTIPESSGCSISRRAPARADRAA